MATPRLRLQDKVAVVTGASNGIGRALALAFSSHGTKLVVCADLQPQVTGDDGEEPTHEVICSLYGTGKAVYVKCDVTIEDSLATAVSEATRLGGRLDILVNNAGLFLEGPLHEFPMEDWSRVMSVNATGAFIGCKTAIRQYLTQPEDSNGERGCIINISSVAALKGMFQSGAYGASKAAIIGLTQEIAVEYGARGIRANAICPGYTETAMLKPWLAIPELRQRFLDAVPLGKLARPSDMTGVAVWLASSAESVYVNGTTVPVDAGFHIK